jgi:hypothetical protein
MTNLMTNRLQWFYPGLDIEKVHDDLAVEAATDASAFYDAALH